MKLHDTETTLRLVIILTIAFALNIVWEYLHSPLYTHYQDEPITNLVLLKAALGDALFITALSIPFYRVVYLNKNLWLIIPAGVAAAIVFELFALSTHRWAYSSLMPLVPLIEIGLTPTIQLGLLGYLSVLLYEVIRHRFQKKKAHIQDLPEVNV